jgi:poly-gamma-glutamate capsule biosynthesis protein CapA/YwtB (metallophosphatase superfamily)
MKSDNYLDIFFLGDTYFGEWHMQLRTKKGQPDVLAQKGYFHFGRYFNEMLNNGDLVIANLECALTDMHVSPLGKDKAHTYAANREKTVLALQASNISVATLANNHAVDFGKAGLIDTLDALEEHGISYIGGGRNIEHASQPCFFHGKTGGNNISLAMLSCYNYRKTPTDTAFMLRTEYPESIPWMRKESRHKSPP